MSTPLPFASDPQDLALAADGDIFLDADGVRFTAGIPAVQQGVQIRLNMVRGEWFLNQDAGMPYLTDLLGDASKKRDWSRKMEVAVAAQILDVPGITSITQLTVARNNQTRAATVTWAARAVFGDVPATTLQTPGL